jgi:hypothetical protein
MTRSLLWLALAATATGIAACSSTSNSTNPPPLVSCLMQVGATSALVFPAQNASAVPDNVGQVIIGTTTTLPSGWNVQLFTTGGLLVASGNRVQPAPSPLPTPNTVPPFANPIYQTSAMPSLPAATTLQVGVNNLNSNCLPSVVGVFTTQ